MIYIYIYIDYSISSWLRDTIRLIKFQSRCVFEYSISQLLWTISQINQRHILLIMGEISTVTQEWSICCCFRWSTESKIQIFAQGDFSSTQLKLKRYFLDKSQMYVRKPGWLSAKWTSHNNYDLDHSLSRFHTYLGHFFSKSGCQKRCAGLLQHTLSFYIVSPHNF